MKSKGQQFEQAFYEEVLRQQQELQVQRVQAARRAAERQQMINEEPRRKYAVIAAVDQYGGFAKEGKIPWHYSEDFKWFKKTTKGHICVMGRKTYEDIVVRQSEKLASSDGVSTAVVLPDRRCFVLSTTATDLTGAVVVKGITEVEHHLTDEDNEKVIFILGGERLFREGLSLAKTVYLTVINKDYQCDKRFPVEFLQEHFVKEKVFKHDNAPDLRFTVWQRKS